MIADVYQGLHLSYVTNNLYSFFLFYISYFLLLSSALFLPFAIRLDLTFQVQLNPLGRPFLFTKGNSTSIIKNIITQIMNVSNPYSLAKGCVYVTVFCNWQGKRSAKTGYRATFDLFIIDTDFFSLKKSQRETTS